MKDLGIDSQLIWDCMARINRAVPEKQRAEAFRELDMEIQRIAENERFQSLLARYSRLARYYTMEGNEIIFYR